MLFIRNLAKCLKPTGRRSQKSLGNSRRRLQIENLETRRCRATFLVDSIADDTVADGSTTIREAVELANAQPGPDVIRFDPALTSHGVASVLLQRGQLPSISDDLSIVGRPAVSE